MTAAATSATAHAGTAVAAATSAGTANGYAQQVVPGVTQLVDGTSATLRQLAGQTGTLASGLDQLAAGANQSQAAALQLSSGAGQLASGADQLAAGAGSLASGVAQVADGTTSLAQGLHTAAAQIPSYSDSQAQSLATVAADPVTASGTSTSLFGASAIPLLAMLALWFGGLASFVVLRAVPHGALASRRSSFLLALRSLAPAAAVGVVQGLLVAVVVEIAASYDLGTWSLFALLCALAGVCFAAVNQALVAVFGGAGRWVAAIVGVLAVATGIVSTVPGWLVAIASVLPTSSATTAMLGVLTSASGTTAGVVGLIVWAAIALLATVIAVARRRTTSARSVLGPLPRLSPGGTSSAQNRCRRAGP